MTPYVARVPLILHTDGRIAGYGTPPGQPRRLPLPCVLSGDRTERRITAPDLADYPLCEICQELPGGPERAEATLREDA